MSCWLVAFAVGTAPQGIGFAEVRGAGAKSQPVVWANLTRWLAGNNGRADGLENLIFDQDPKTCPSWKSIFALGLRNAVLTPYLAASTGQPDAGLSDCLAPQNKNL